MEYQLKKRNFTRALKFSIKYHLDPSKTQSGRRSGEPRGLGAVIDNFTRGKLAEIGLQKMLEAINSRKKYVLDFDIKPTQLIKEDPDIVAIKEGDVRREPNVFVEIKNLGEKDRWLGLSGGQIESVENGANGKPIHLVYVSIVAESISENARTTDLLGMYLRSVASTRLFDSFSRLNAIARLEYVLTWEDLWKFGTEFFEGEYLYETDLFASAEITRKDGGLRKGIKKIRNSESYNGRIRVRGRYDEFPPKNINEFKFKGAFDIYLKKNEKSNRRYIYCLKDTTLWNDVFGTFKFMKGECHDFNLETLGWQSDLNQDNIWISKRRLSELISEGKVAAAVKGLEVIAKSI